VHPETELNVPTTTIYIWDDANLLAETDGMNVINVVYTNEPQHFGNLVSSRISGTTSYHHFDSLGSTRQLTSTTPHLTDSVIYDAWGNVVNSSGSTEMMFLWVGEIGYYRDAETSELSIRRRNYRSRLATWGSQDPSFASDLRFITSSITNPYLYVENNPANKVDPTGLECRDTKPPLTAIPSEDEYFPVREWRSRGGATTLGNKTFSGVTCDDCTMDIEVKAKAYRYFRWFGGRFVDHSGQPSTGLSIDPLDFFSLVVVTVCKTNINCGCAKMPDVTETLTSIPLEKGGVGIFIQACDTCVRSVYSNFKSDDACDYANDLIRFIQQNVRVCPK
jgi:RHS repeat-associated protein